MDDLTIISRIIPYIGVGIVSSLLFFFFAFSFFVYLNGREIGDYYLILFGKLTIKDAFFIFISTCVVCSYLILANVDKITSNDIKIEFIETKQETPREFNFNINVNHSKQWGKKEDD